MNTSLTDDRRFIELSDLSNAAGTIIDRLNDLKSSIPESAQWHLYQIKSSLSMVKDGVTFKKQLFVDSWPKYTCVMLFREFDLSTDEAEVFCPDDEESKTLSYILVARFLKCLEKRKVRLITLPYYLHFIVDNLRDLYDVKVEVDCRNHIRFNLPESKNVSLDDQVVCKPLTEDHISSVSSHWPYSKSDSSPIFLREMLKVPRYNFGLFDDEMLVAHVLKGRQGTMSMLYVDPAYRGKNYGKYLVQEYSKACMEDHEPVILETDSSYEANKTFFDHCGFTVVSKTAYFIIFKK